MLIRYLRDKTDDLKHGDCINRGRPIGVIVALSPKQIGYAIMNPKDKWDRKLAKEIATARAKVNKHPPVPKREVIVFRRQELVYTTLDKLVPEMVQFMADKIDRQINRHITESNGDVASK